MRTHSPPGLRTLAGAGVLSLALLAGACGGDDGDGSTDTDAPTENDDTAAPAETEAPAETDAPEETEAPQEETADTAMVEGEVATEDLVEEEDSGPVAGGTVRYGVQSDVDGLNPTTSGLSPSGLVMGNAVFDTLTAFDIEGNTVPYLAESVEPVGGDTSMWQVELRQGVSFHDGTPLDADAVIQNWETTRLDPLIGIAIRPFYPCSPSREEGCDSGQEPIEKIDDLTVQYNLLEPNAYFPLGLAGQGGMMASPAWLAAALDDPTLNQQPVGTGPFVFDSRSQDSTTRFVRNDEWWNGEVHLDAIEFVVDTDPDSLAQRLLAGELEAMATDTTATVGDLQDEESVQNVIDETGEERFAVLNSEVPPFDDVRARRALALATPREEYDLLIGLGISRMADQRYIPESKWYNSDVIQEGDDPEGAAALAAEYCAERGEEQNPVLGSAACTDGRINIQYKWSGPSVINTRIAELLDEGWSDAFNVTFNELPEDEVIQQTVFGQYNVSWWRSFGSPDPSGDDVWLLCRTAGGISLNLPRYCSEERDALLLAARASEDESERIELYRQQTADMNQEYLYIFFEHSMWDNAFSPEVRGQCERLSPDGIELRCAINGRTWHDSLWLAE
jgi:peptide/nickel transport system substrate-binding protein